LVRQSSSAPLNGFQSSHHLTPSGISHNSYSLPGHVSFHSPWPSLIRTLGIDSCPNVSNSTLFGTDFLNTLDGSTTQACTCINHCPISSLSIGSLTDDSTAAVVGIGPSLNRCYACQHHNQSQVHTELISHSTDQSTKAPHGNQGQSLDTTGYVIDQLTCGDATTYFWVGADIPKADNDSHYCSHEGTSCGLSADSSFTSSPFDTGYCSDISKQRSFADVVAEESYLEGCSHHDFRNLPRFQHKTHAYIEQQAGLPSSTIRIEKPTGEVDARRASLGRGALSSKSKRLIHRYLFTFFY
jgi:hypothetical protein